MPTRDLTEEEKEHLLKLKQFIKPELFTPDRGVTVTQIPHGADIPEKPPAKTEGVAIWELVIQDMLKRDLMGAQKYGTRLQAFNGRDPLWDAYQEALDLVVYLRQAIEERDSKKDKDGYEYNAPVQKESEKEFPDAFSLTRDWSEDDD